MKCTDIIHGCVYTCLFGKISAFEKIKIITATPPPENETLKSKSDLDFKIKCLIIISYYSYYSNSSLCLSS